MPVFGLADPSNDPVKFIQGPAVTAVSIGVTTVSFETNEISLGSLNLQAKSAIAFGIVRASDFQTIYQCE